MSSWTNLSKNSASFTNLSKSSGVVSNLNKTIRPWSYNEAGYIYKQVTDSITGQPVNYNSIGSIAWTNQSKS